MNIIITIFFATACLIAGLLIIALFSKKAYAISNAINIRRSNSEVFNYIRYLKNQDAYNKWVMMDPGMRKIFKGEDGKQGFVYAWDGNKKAGAGEQEIKKITGENRIDIEIRFKRPFKGLARSYMQ